MYHWNKLTTKMLQKLFCRLLGFNSHPLQRFSCLNCCFNRSASRYSFYLPLNWRCSKNVTHEQLCKFAILRKQLSVLMYMMFFFIIILSFLYFVFLTFNILKVEYKLIFQLISENAYTIFVYTLHHYLFWKR